jgi:hypothetical protein
MYRTGIEEVTERIKAVSEQYIEAARAKAEALLPDRPLKSDILAKFVMALALNDFLKQDPNDKYVIEFLHYFKEQFENEYGISYESVIGGTNDNCI